jgi:hypothetical protein
MNRRSFLASTAGVMTLPGKTGRWMEAVAGSSTKGGDVQVPFYFVDVFAEEPLTGNPLSIVPNSQALDEATMKRIAGELNQAETTFLSPSKKADWHLRSFTAPGHEVFGAGHNSLGAWWWLADSGKLKLKDGSNRFYAGDRRQGASGGGSQRRRAPIGGGSYAVAACL